MSVQFHESPELNKMLSSRDSSLIESASDATVVLNEGMDPRMVYGAFLTGLALGQSVRGSRPIFKLEHHLDNRYYFFVGEEREVKDRIQAIPTCR